jgi:hypothetical protein
MDETDGQVAHLAIVPISTSVTRLGTRWDLCDKSGIRHRHAQNLNDAVVLSAVNDIETLTADLSRKIWQKITILATADPRRHPATASTLDGETAG